MLFNRKHLGLLTAFQQVSISASSQAGSRKIERGRGRMSETTSRAEMERRLIERSLQDDAFRQQLLDDPKAAVEQELGTRLPNEVSVEAVEETADTFYLVLPSASQAWRRRTV